MFPLAHLGRKKTCELQMQACFLQPTSRPFGIACIRTPAERDPVQRGDPVLKPIRKMMTWVFLAFMGLMPRVADAQAAIYKGVVSDSVNGMVLEGVSVSA